MSTSAYIGRITDEGYKTRRLNFDGDPETVLTVLNQILQRDTYEDAADTILAHGEWRSLDPTALDPAPEGSDYATVVGYGEVYTDGDPVDPNEQYAPSASFTSDDGYVYLLNVEDESVLYLDPSGDNGLTWRVGDDIPSSRDTE